MNSFKSTCVVLVLAGVLYGVYVTLHAPPASNTAHHAPHDHADVEPPSIDFGPAATASLLSNSPLAPAVTLPVAGVRTTTTPAINVPAAFVSNDQGPRTELPPLVPPCRYRHTAGRSACRWFRTPGSRPGGCDVSGLALSSARAHKLKRAMTDAEQHVADGKFRDALATLSPLASNHNLTAEQRTQLFAWLDVLAGKVIYSREHHLREPHRVTGKNENLYDIAAANKVDMQLLFNINSQVVNSPITLVPGTELKMIPGPFRAELSLGAEKLTLYVGQLYAGRFTFAVGEEVPKLGTYRVQDNRRDRVYYGRNGQQLAAADPANPYGGFWIDLGSEASLHGSPQTSTPGPALGCLSFNSQDANDLFAILNKHSDVVIKP